MVSIPKIMSSYERFPEQYHTVFTNSNSFIEVFIDVVLTPVIMAVIIYIIWLVIWGRKKQRKEARS